MTYASYYRYYSSIESSEYSSGRCVEDVVEGEVEGVEAILLENYDLYDFYRASMG